MLIFLPAGPIAVAFPHRRNSFITEVQLLPLEIRCVTNSCGLTQEQQCNATRRCPFLLSNTSYIITRIWEHDAGENNYAVTGIEFV
jgi:hypothetical protein